jgi:hypothetical protein
MTLHSHSSMPNRTSLRGQEPAIRGCKNESQDRAFRLRGIMSRQRHGMAGGVGKVGAGLDHGLLSFESERGPQKHKRSLTFVQALFSPRMVSMTYELGGCHA